VERSTLNEPAAFAKLLPIQAPEQAEQADGTRDFLVARAMLRVHPAVSEVDYACSS
jgi:hypothetical protein